MNNDKKFYVYLHRRKTDGKVFYVGKGMGRRAWNVSTRSTDWLDCVEDHGYTIDVVVKSIREVCAFSIEVALISFHASEYLVNKTNGGDGLSGWVPPAKWINARTGNKNPRYDSTVYAFFHKDHGIVNLTKSDFSEKYAVNIFGVYSICSGSRSHVGGWHLDGTIPNFQKGAMHPSYDHTEFNFTHKEHGNVICTRYHLCKKYNINRSNLNEMIRGVYKTSKGWRLKI